MAMLSTERAHNKGVKLQLAEAVSLRHKAEAAFATLLERHEAMLASQPQLGQAASTDSAAASQRASSRVQDAASHAAAIALMVGARCLDSWADLCGCG